MQVVLRTAPSNPGANKNMLVSSRSLKSSGNPIIKMVEMSIGLLLDDVGELAPELDVLELEFEILKF